MIQAIVFAFLAMDDKPFNERIDETIYSILQPEETNLSDKTDDIIVVINGALGLNIFSLNRHHFRFSPRFTPYAKLALGQAFAMMICDMKGIYGHSENLNQTLGHLEEWIKTFGGGALFIGLLCAVEDALHAQPEDSQLESETHPPGQVDHHPAEKRIGKLSRVKALKHQVFEATPDRGTALT